MKKHYILVCLFCLAIASFGAAIRYIPLGTNGTYTLNLPGGQVYYIPLGGNGESPYTPSTNDPSILAWWNGDSITNEITASSVATGRLFDRSTNGWILHNFPGQDAIQTLSNGYGNLAINSTNLTQWSRTSVHLNNGRDSFTITNTGGNITLGALYYQHRVMGWSFGIKRATNGSSITNLQAYMPLGSAKYTNIYIDDDWRYYLITNNPTAGSWSLGWANTNTGAAFHTNAVLVTNIYAFPYEPRFDWDTNKFTNTFGVRLWPGRNGYRTFQATFQIAPFRATNTFNHPWPITIYTVSKYPSINALAYAWDTSESSTYTTAGRTNGLQGVNAGALRLTAKGLSITNSGWSSNNWGVVCAILNSNNSLLQFNQQVPVTGTIGTVTNSYGFALADSATVDGNFVMQHNNAEIMIRNGADDWTTRSNIIRYLILKYSLTNQTGFTPAHP